ncbi:MAG: hydrogenase maturation protease [Bacteroidales bacterium]|nr:hydrogenase maturation protease [Bacteroidales bacterium]
MNKSKLSILFYAYGNPGRMDDGLGNEFVERFELWTKQQGLRNFLFDSNYQLNIEDAEEISDKDIVVFVDASEEDIEDYLLTEVDGSSKVSFTTHAASPGYVVQLCEKLYKKKPKVYLLHIKGYEWEFKEGLSQKAEENLVKAIEFIKEKFQYPEKLL